MGSHVAGCFGDLPSDDWPYLYLPDLGITPLYASMMAILALIAALTVLGVSSEIRLSVMRRRVRIRICFYSGWFYCSSRASLLPR